MRLLAQRVRECFSSSSPSSSSISPAKLPVIALLPVARLPARSLMAEPERVTTSPTATVGIVLVAVVVPDRVMVRMFPSTFQRAPPSTPSASKKLFELFMLRIDAILPALTSGLLVVSEKVSSLLSPASFVEEPPVFLAAALTTLGAVVSAVRVLVVTAVTLGEFAEVMIPFAARVALMLSAGLASLQVAEVAIDTKNFPPLIALFAAVEILV